MKNIVNSLLVLLVLSVVTGLLYPLFVTFVANAVFPYQAKGSILTNRDGQVIGSTLIGQKFPSAHHFQSRPSATGYSALPSGGSNLPLSSNTLRDSVISRQNNFNNANNIATGAPVPKEMLFASASGLDPNISPKSAYLQLNRVSRACGYDHTYEIRKLIEHTIRYPQFGFLGKSRVNVLILNYELDSLLNARP